MGKYAEEGGPALVGHPLAEVAEEGIAGAGDRLMLQVVLPPERVVAIDLRAGAPAAVCLFWVPDHSPCQEIPQLPPACTSVPALSNKMLMMIQKLG